jgi:hypothetical protein
MSSPTSPLLVFACEVFARRSVRLSVGPRRSLVELFRSSEYLLRSRVEVFADLPVSGVRSSTRIHPSPASLFQAFPRLPTSGVP